MQDFGGNGSDPLNEKSELRAGFGYVRVDLASSLTWFRKADKTLSWDNKEKKASCELELVASAANLSPISLTATRPIKSRKKSLKLTSYSRHKYGSSEKRCSLKKAQGHEKSTQFKIVLEEDSEDGWDHILIRDINRTLHITHFLHFPQILRSSWKKLRFKVYGSYVEIRNSNFRYLSEILI